nr:MAG TPA: hypothetical protein [Caudoviricetes sp.]DAZ13557.1 MAG TPA: hypothetical protein [Caudoviricetes sp.]
MVLHKILMQLHSQKKLLQTSNLRGFVPLFFLR